MNEVGIFGSKCAVICDVALEVVDKLAVGNHKFPHIAFVDGAGILFDLIDAPVIGLCHRQVVRHRYLRCIHSAQIRAQSVVGAVVRHGIGVYAEVHVMPGRCGGNVARRPGQPGLINLYVRSYGCRVPSLVQIDQAWIVCDSRRVRLRVVNDHQSVAYGVSAGGGNLPVFDQSGDLAGLVAVEQQFTAVDVQGEVVLNTQTADMRRTTVQMDK